jgi:hypothetical protein
VRVVVNTTQAAKHRTFLSFCSDYPKHTSKHCLQIFNQNLCVFPSIDRSFRKPSHLKSYSIFRTSSPNFLLPPTTSRHLYNTTSQQQQQQQQQSSTVFSISYTHQPLSSKSVPLILTFAPKPFSPLAVSRSQLHVLFPHHHRLWHLGVVSALSRCQSVGVA